MRTEKIVLSFIAIFVGLCVAGVAFYFYQSTKVISPTATKVAVTTSTPTPTPIDPNSLLSIQSPKDEAVVTSKTVTVNGKTDPNATIVISTPVDDQVATPSSNGDFTTTVTIDSGENQIIITAIAPDGQEVNKKLTVTYSTENF